MRRYLSVILSLTMMICFFTGCKKTQELDDKSGGGTTTPTQSAVIDATENSNITNPLETTEFLQTESTESATQPTAPKPTEPNPTEPAEGNEKIIAGGDWDFGPVKWKITDDGVLSFSGNRSIQAKPTYIWKDYTNIVTKVVFEEGITTVPENAFSDMYNIKSVHFGDAVKQIGDNAFSGCTSLESVTISKGIKTIGEYAFWKCANLKSLSFAADCTLEEIKTGAFAETGLRELNTPPSLRIIRGGAFQNCKSLKTVRLEGGVQEVFGESFKNCTGLESIVLGESLTDVSSYAFKGCKAVTTLEYNTSVGMEFGEFTQLTTVSIGGNRTETGHFNHCTSLKNVTIGTNITEISDRAFRDTGVETITIPPSVTKIGLSAFRDSALKELYFTGNAPTFARNTSSFIFLNVTATAYYPAGDPTWRESVRQNYDGTITWVAK